MIITKTITVKRNTIYDVDAAVGRGPLTSLKIGVAIIITYKLHLFSK